MNLAHRQDTMKQHGYTAIDNRLFDLQPHISTSAFSMLIRIERMTTGYQCDQKALSNSFLQTLCNMSKNTVTKAIDELLELGILLSERQHRKTTIYAVNHQKIFEIVDDSQNLTKQENSLDSQKLTMLLPKNDQVSSQKLGSIKLKQNKNLLNKNSLVQKAKSKHLRLVTDDKPKPPVKKTKILNIPFSDFWNIYDKKKDTAKCEKKWSSLTDNERELIMAHIPAYVKSTPDKKYRKNPMTYLNGKCWLDEIDQPTATKIDRTTDKLAVNQNWEGANKSNIVESNTTLEEMMGSW